MASLRELGLEDKYVVIKREDINLLSEHDRNEIDNMLGEIAYKRLNAGKQINSYIVVNTDEPYALEVADLVTSSK